MATSWGGGPLLEMAAKPAAGLIDELTRGRVKLEVLAGGALGNPLKVSESVRTGAAQAGHSWAGYDWNVDKAVVLFGGYAGGLNGEQMLHWLYQGGGKALYRQFRLEKFGVVSMPCGALPAEIGMHSRKPVQHLADFNGLKLRTAGVWAEIAPGLGVTVVNVPGTEVYAALENGTIDAVESAQLSIDKAIGFHQITKYLILPGIHQPSTVQECSFNKAAWDSLAEADRRAIEIAAQTVTFDLYQRIGDDDLDAYQFLKQSGSTILLLDDEVKAKARELAFAWADKIADEEGPESWFKKVLDAQRAYQRKWADSRSLRVTVVDPR